MTVPQNATFSIPGDALRNNELSLPGRNPCNSAMMNSAASLLQNLFTNPAIQPSSVINISNSSDIVIGSMNQYQGPVTIYQYMDTTVEARTMHAKGDIRKTNTTQNSTTLLQKILKNGAVLVVLISIISFVFICVAGVAIYLTLGREDNNSREILSDSSPRIGTFPHLGKSHDVIYRFQWGGKDHSLSKKLEHPIPYVLITHVGDQQSPCENMPQCSIKLQMLQESDIAEQGLPDIKSNFYVGNDGNLYVGRGWNFVNTYENKSLAICFIGDFNRYKPSEKSLEAVQYLLTYAMNNRYVALDYKLVGHNQTKTTKSPGINVSREIVTWPHWYSCGQSGHPACGAEIGLPEVWNATQ